MFAVEIVEFNNWETVGFQLSPAVLMLPSVCEVASRELKIQCASNGVVADCK